MSRKVKKSSFRVEVMPMPMLLWHGDDLEKAERYYTKECQDLEKQIKRHVDGVHEIYFVWDTEVVCEHCGHGWEEDELGTPLCCTQAEEEWLEENSYGYDVP